MEMGPKKSSLSSFLPERGREEKEEKLNFLDQYSTANFLKYPHFSSSVSPRFSC